MEQTESNSGTVLNEPKMRLNIKMSAKGNLQYEYTVRADSVEELAVLSAQVKLLAEKTISPKPTEPEPEYKPEEFVEPVAGMDG